MTNILNVFHYSVSKESHIIGSNVEALHMEKKITGMGNSLWILV